MVQFASIMLRGVIAMFVGLLIAGGALTFAADRATPRPTLVPVAPDAPATLDVPDVTGQAYVFAKGILQDHGFAWHVSGLVQGYAANIVATQQPPAGTTVLDSGAPLITLTLSRNSAYLEKGTPENDSPYTGTAIRLPANVREKPVTSVTPQLEPVTPQPTPIPAAKPVTSPTPVASPAPAAMPTPVPAPTPVAAPPVVTPTPVAAPTSAPKVTKPKVTKPAAPKPTPKVAKPKVTAPKPAQPTRLPTLPDRVAALAAFVEAHRSPSAVTLNHWLYEHAYIVAAARFDKARGAEALRALIALDKRVEKLWGVATTSRIAARQALAEVEKSNP